MLVFDEAPPSASDHPFEERYTHLLQNVPFDSPFLLSLLIIQLFAYCNNIIIVIIINVDFWYIPAPRVSGVGKRQISKLILEIINDGGEGIMMRRPASLYEHGRSTSLIKYKVFICYFIFLNFFLIMLLRYSLLIIIIIVIARG